MSKTAALELKNISKSFGSVVANKNVDLTLYKGEILALLGENGSGKTTLMNMIAGIYYPDEGQIFVDGKEAVISSPKDAFGYGIGMIHQHFKLVDVFSASENIILGVKDGRKFNIKNVNATVGEICRKYGFNIDPKKKIYEMSVSEKQTVEIIKVIYRGAEILILDEPTAVLTPQESGKLFDILRKMREDGKSIIIITHKLHEVLSISDRVAVLRRGEHIATVNTAETNESELTEMMVGKKVTLNIARSEPVNPHLRLSVKGVTGTDADGIKVLDNVSFSVNSGEILGIAGIAGSGQRELLEAIAGLQHIDSGEITYISRKTGESVNLRDKTPLQIRDLGVRLSFVPEDRLGMGLVGNMNITDNMMLRSYQKGKSMFLDREKPKALAEEIIKSLEVVTPGLTTPVRRLSGGNVQKVLVGREIASSPSVLMAAYPVRGLDINSSYMIYNLLNKQKENGVAVIFVGEDLDVLIELCDRIMVICGGKITGIVDGRTAVKEEIGLLMTKHEPAEYTAEEGKE
ncbi:MAG: ABC transporter ATP-binding protein [Firmicutes bacterium]|uniref:ABC transporter ATP-binding protein n=1 Tax=Candidatus Colimorpha enterica TaxID=3083063 RepID=A0AAE3FGL6_9BACT|nr:ABC transporter ATP-binding protein [Candidatus Colimorpha enterica]MCI5756021.1 ABC transporter ATP-binding protein [Candidatus Colimorpha enterica]MDD6322252.1 ABC transporter ATP-binding protein [Bacillota bacterium]